MADLYLVHVDQAKFAANLAVAERREFSPIEVREFLIENSFTSTPLEWVCEEISSRSLQRNEYIQIRHQ